MLLVFTVLSVSLGCRPTAGVNPGSMFTAEVNNSDVQEIAQFAVTALNALTARHSFGNVTLARVIKAEKQIVAGINYYLDVEVKEQGCTSHCRTELCTLTVSDQAWTNTRALHHRSCHVSNRKRHLLGGSKAISVDNNEVQKAAQAAVNALNARSTALNADVLLRVNSATYQVFAGTRYNMEIVVGRSKCRNRPSTDLSQCPPVPDTTPKTCSVSVVHQLRGQPEYMVLLGPEC